MKHAVASVGGVVICAMFLSINPVAAQGTAFTYQGRLNNTGQPANGSYDFRFRLASDPLGNNYVGSSVLTNGVPVANGLFTVAMDFGPGLFTGSNLWLEVDVRTNGGGSYTVLNPLQPLTPAPYAIFANTASNLSGTLSAGQLSGPVANGQLANSTITVNAGTGLSGGGAVALGGSTTLNNAGILSVTGNSDITASTIAGAVTLGDTATSANTPITLVKRDGTGSFSAGSLTLSGQLNLPAAPVTVSSGGSLLMRTDGNRNFFAAQNAGNTTLTGTDNTGVGAFALEAITSGSWNAASGGQALFNNTSGGGNTANGYQALYSNTTGGGNTASGTYALFANTNGTENVANGYSALNSNTGGSGNTANGAFSLYSNTSGGNNVANGANALYSNGSGFGNTADGYQALYANTNGFYNVANGYQALHSNNSGNDNTANGAFALYQNTSGAQNSANGYYALFGNTSGAFNTAAGAAAMQFNTTGNNNTANGASALQNNTTGSDNTADGSSALVANTNGQGNTASGFQAMAVNTSGAFNTAAGYNSSLENTIGSYNTANGSYALAQNTTGSNNISLGYFAGYNVINGSFNIHIGNTGSGTDSNTIRIGSGQAQTFVAGIYGDLASGGLPVYINSSGQLGTASDAGTVALLGASQTFTAANTFNGTVTLDNTVQDFATVFMNDRDIQFRNDTLHGVGWYGAGKLFAGLNVNGPAMYGSSGGVLGSKGATTNAALLWDQNGQVNVDPLGVNNGTLLPGITFGVSSGEGIASRRTAGGGQFGLEFYTFGVNRMTVANNGLVGIGTNTPQQALHVVGNILATGTVTGSSDRNAKENFAPVNSREVLDKVAALPISRWNYKHEPEITHLGPMAQDFHAAFDVGQDDKHISMVDADGVALAAIQGLNQKVEELSAELKRRDIENAELKQRLETLEKARLTQVSN